MAFRIDDLSIQLMPSDKEKDEERGRDKCRQKTRNVDPDDTLGQNCTEATGPDYQPEVQRPDCVGASSKEAAGQGYDALVLLQARLREALASPPV